MNTNANMPIVEQKNIENNNQVQTTGEVYAMTDTIAAVLMALLAFCSRFISWYGFYITEDKHPVLYKAFGPYGGIGKENGEVWGMERISSILNIVQILLIVGAILFVVYITFLLLPKFSASRLPSIVGIVYYAVMLAAVVMGFIGTVGKTEPEYLARATVGLGWYIALVSSLAGIALCAAPTLVSRLIRSYKE